MNRRFGWKPDPSDSNYFIHDEEQQALLDKAARYRTNGLASWQEIADIFTRLSDRTITRASLVSIIERERPECLKTWAEYSKNAKR